MAIYHTDEKERIQCPNCNSKYFKEVRYFSCRKTKDKSKQVIYNLVLEKTVLECEKCQASCLSIDPKTEHIYYQLPHG